MRPDPRQTGLSIIELIVALAIIAIVLTFGVPSLGRLLATAEVRAQASALRVALAAARMRAVERQHPVGLCPLDRDGECMPAADWSRGWMVFDDPRSMGRPRSPAAVFEVRHDATPQVRASSTAGRRSVVFRRDGTSAGSNVTVTLCHPGYPGVGRQVVVSNVGRARSGPLPRDWQCRD